ncbi:Gfo/Idh/MocA family oxidoreductase [Halomontanus rarus]|uniref:Gfo/Idh/MocA family oxidoreductase n=1 Tax=Halomontanus rarus TaxID=3034020 RepID=UPI001A9886EB
MQSEKRLDVGVIGVGSMGHHHARVYESLPRANLVGVFDLDEERATAVARDHETSAMGLDSLLAAVDAVSIAVPTSAHYDVLTRCLDASVAALVEKPIVGDLETGEKLREKAIATDVPLQVGHIERFNPVVTTLEELLENFSVISLASQRLGPPPNTQIDDSAVLDLMIHDIDVVLSLLDEIPSTIKGTGVRKNHHASALLEFDSDVMASLTASHRTQRKVRTLEITADEGLIVADYMNQSIEIHRRSVPEYVEQNGAVRFRHESTIERLHIPSEEPLRNELESFLNAVVANELPEVTVDDGLIALEVAKRVERHGAGAQPSGEESSESQRSERDSAMGRGEIGLINDQWSRGGE